MRIQRSLLATLVVLLAVGIAQAQRPEDSRARERLQKKTKIAETVQAKVRSQLRVQKNLADEEQEQAAVLKGGSGPDNGTGTGDGDQDQYQYRIREQKKEYGENCDPKQEQSQTRTRKQLQDGSCDEEETTLKGSGAGPGDGTCDGDCDGDGEPDQLRTRDRKKECLAEDCEPKQDWARDRDQLRDGSCGDQEEVTLKGSGAGPGDGGDTDGDGEPDQDQFRIRERKKEYLGEDCEPKQEQTRERKRLQDGSCDDEQQAAVLKGNGAGPAYGAGYADTEPDQDQYQYRVRAQKRESLEEDWEPKQEQTQTRARKQLQDGSGGDDEELTYEFLLFLKDYFAEQDAKRNTDPVRNAIHKRDQDRLTDGQGKLTRALIRSQLRK